MRQETLRHIVRVERSAAWRGAFALLAAAVLAATLAPAVARLPLLLGDPRVGNAAVLVMLLLAASTAASWLAAAPRVDARVQWRALAALAAAALLAAATTALPATALAQAPVWQRAAAAAAVAAAIGFALGLPLPLAQRVVGKHAPRLAPAGRALPLVLTATGAVLAVAAPTPGVAAIGAALLAAGIAGSVAAAATAAAAQPAPGPIAWRPAGHFYSPIPDVEQVRNDAARLFAPGLHELPGLALELDAQHALLRELARFHDDADLPPAPRADRRYTTANDFFGAGDAFVYQAMLRRLRPRRVVEVGAGWSSALLLDTDERHLGGRTECTLVEPFPQRLLELLRPADHARVRLLQQRVQDVPLATFDALEAGDVLFVDSSHVCKTGSDVHHLVFTVLPRLARGVHVHFHDVCANFEYPPDWVYEGRAWNESYVLRALLTGSRDWRVVLHAASLAAAGAPEVAALPLLAGHGGGSLWLVRV